MIDMQYQQVLSLLKAMVQTWGGEYEENIVEPIVQHVSIPQVARVYPWKSIMKPYSQTITNGTTTYNLPYDFEKFYGVPKTKYGAVTELTPSDFHALFPDRSDRNSNDFGFYTVEEYEGALNQPTSAEQMSVVSDNASDTETVLIRGEVDNLDDYEEVTLNGTTAVTTTKSLTHISYVTKSDVTSGIVTVSGVTSGTTMTKIPAEHLTAQYKRLLVDTNSTETLTLYGQYLSKVFKPVRQYDVMRVPADLVFLHALALMGWERRDVTNQLSIEKKYQNEISMAIRSERKSYSIESGMEQSNGSRKKVSKDYPLNNCIY